MTKDQEDAIYAAYLGISVLQTMCRKAGLTMGVQRSTDRDPAQKAGRFDSDPDAEFFSRDMDYIAAEIERPLRPDHEAQSRAGPRNRQHSALISSQSDEPLP